MDSISDFSQLIKTNSGRSMMISLFIFAICQVINFITSKIIPDLVQLMHNGPAIKLVVFAVRVQSWLSITRVAVQI
jgi:hypothetical protein